MKRPPAYPTELAYPCCLPALGELGKMPPHGGLAPSVGEPRDGHQDGTTIGTGTGGFHAAVDRPVLSSAEDSPSGLWRSLGKRVGLTALAGSNPASSARRLECEYDVVVDTGSHDPRSCDDRVFEALGLALVGRTVRRAE